MPDPDPPPSGGGRRPRIPTAGRRLLRAAERMYAQLRSAVRRPGRPRQVLADRAPLDRLTAATLASTLDMLRQELVLAEQSLDRAAAAIGDDPHAREQAADAIHRLRRVADRAERALAGPAG